MINATRLDSLRYYILFILIFLFFCTYSFSFLLAYYMQVTDIVLTTTNVPKGSDTQGHRIDAPHIIDRHVNNHSEGAEFEGGGGVKGVTIGDVPVTNDEGVVADSIVTTNSSLQGIELSTEEVSVNIKIYVAIDHITVGGDTDKGNKIESISSQSRSKDGVGGNLVAAVQEANYESEVRNGDYNAEANGDANLRKILKLLPPLRKPTGCQQSPVWQSMLLLQSDDPRKLKIVDYKNVTHFCFYCKKLFAIPYRVSERGEITSGCYC